MTLDRGVRIALDIGAATASAALVTARSTVGDACSARSSLPAGVDEDRLVEHLVERVRAADPSGAERLGLDRAAADAPRLVVRSSPPPTLAVLATTVRECLAVERVAGVAGWRTRGASHDVDGPIGLTRTALGRDVTAIAVSGEPATSREGTAALAELAAVVGGIARRPTAPALVLAGEMARDDLPYGPLGSAGERVVYAPGPGAGEPAGEPLRHLLDRLDPDPATPRRAALAALLELAVVLDRRIELIEVGFDGGLRAIAGRDGLEAPPAIVPSAGFVPDDLDDETVDAILAWSTVALDRHRMRDRLRELRLSPWVEAYGDGARLRLAAVRAAVARMVAATPWLEALPAPDLVVVAGGGWAAAPGPAMALAIADVVRRPGASQLAFDHARLLGPLGGVADPVERRGAALTELADDLLSAAGGVVVEAACGPAGRRPADSPRVDRRDRARSCRVGCGWWTPPPDGQLRWPISAPRSGAGRGRRP